MCEQSYLRESYCTAHKTINNDFSFDLWTRKCARKFYRGRRWWMWTVTVSTFENQGRNSFPVWILNYLILGNADCILRSQSLKLISSVPFGCQASVTWLAERHIWHLTNFDRFPTFVLPIRSHTYKDLKVRVIYFCKVYFQFLLYLEGNIFGIFCIIKDYTRTSNIARTKYNFM